MSIDARDKYVELVTSSMNTELNIDQLRLLRNVMYASMDGIDISFVTEKALALNQNDNINIIKNFYLAKRIQGLSEKTIKNYLNELKKFFLTINKRVQDVKTADVQLYLAKKMVNTSKSNADCCRRYLSTFYSWCEEEEIVARSPLKKIKKIKCSKTIRKPFSTEEIELMRQQCDTVRNRAIFEFLLSTACRASEMIALNIKDVDIVTGEAIVTGKGDKQRPVYLNAVSKVYLKQYLDSRKDSNPALFVSEPEPHDRLQVSGIEIVIRRIGRVVGTKAFPHRLRHTAATMALKRGMPIQQVQKMLGHEKIDTTLIYAKTLNDDVKYSHGKYC